MNHAQARTHVDAGFQQKFGRPPTIVESQLVQGVGWLETNYGAGWKGAGKGSNNMGADQYGQPPCEPGKSFLYTDTNPTSGGGSVPYQICFRWYATPADGFAGLVNIVYVQKGKDAPEAPTKNHHRGREMLAAAAAGSIHDASVALYDSTYYRGFGPTRDVRIANHYRALRTAVNLRAAALGEKMPNGFDPLVRVLKFNWLPMRGEDVKRVQRVVGIKDDGWFGPGTKKKVFDFQSSIPGLLADGVVGLDTWEVVQEHEGLVFARAA